MFYNKISQSRVRSATLTSPKQIHLEKVTSTCWFFGFIPPPPHHLARVYSYLFQELIVQRQMNSRKDSPNQSQDTYKGKVQFSSLGSGGSLEQGNFIPSATEGLGWGPALGLRKLNTTSLFFPTPFVSLSTTILERQQRALPHTPPWSVLSTRLFSYESLLLGSVVSHAKTSSPKVLHMKLASLKSPKGVNKSVNTWDAALFRLHYVAVGGIAN